MPRGCPLSEPAICVIVNPGSRDGEEAGRELHDALGGRGDVVIRQSLHEGHARELAAEAAREGFATVVAAGGDGTVNEVVNGLEPFLDRVRLGILPRGTGNDFARTLGLPEGLAEGLAILTRGEVRRCDLVEVTAGDWRRVFINVSAGGFSADMNENLTADVKQAWGPLAYFRAAAESLPERTVYRASLLFDDHWREVEAVLNVVVANGRFVAGGIPVAPYAEIDDGLFDVVVVKECSLAALATLAPKVLVGGHLEDTEDLVAFRQARRLVVASEPPMRFNVDGEMLGEETITFRILPGALEVVAPSAAPIAGSEGPPIVNGDAKTRS